MEKTLDSKQLELLVQHHVVSSAVLKGNPENSFTLRVTIEDEEKQLMTSRKSVKTFRTLDTAYKLLKSIGIKEVIIDMS